MDIEKGFSIIEEDNRLLVKAIESSVTGVAIADMRLPDFPLIYINPGFERLTGYSSEETLGKNCRFLQGSDRRQLEREIIRDALEKGKECKVIIRNYRKNGTMFWNELSMSPVRNEQGELTHFISIQHDVSKEVEARQKNEELSRKLKLQTELMETMLQELESFSYSVSHDLRAPLNLISGYGDLLQRQSGDNIDEKGKRYLQIILDSSRKMGQLIDELLTLSRISRIEMRIAKINAEEIVNNCLEILKDQTKDRQIEFKIGTLPDIEADASMLETAFQHLLSNAIKYSGKKEQAIIEIRSESQGEFNVFSVKDNGAGFDPRYKHKLFGVFQRLHRDDEFEGVGIGLAIAKKVISRHNGEIWADAELEKGATFCFSIPKIPFKQ